MGLLTKWAVLSLLFAGIWGTALGQYTEPATAKKESNRFFDRVYFGGNFGLMLGSVTQIEISPLAGYRLTEHVSVGMGLSYQYYRENIPYYASATNIDTFTYKMSIYGGKLFGTWTPIPDIGEYLPLSGLALLLHVENEILNVGSYVKHPSGQYYYYQDGKRQWINNLMAGGGISQKIGERATVNLMILWNLTESDFTPYSNPTMRVGFTF